MNWEQLSEKLTKDKKGRELVVIFCDPEDREDEFIQNKIDLYKGRGLKVTVKNAKEKKREKNTVSVRPEQQKSS